MLARAEPNQRSIVPVGASKTSDSVQVAATAAAVADRAAARQSASRSARAAEDEIRRA